MDEIIIKPIGVIKTPYDEPKDIPIQGKFKPETLGEAVILDKYKKGLKDLNGFSHAVFLYHLDRSKEERLLGKPFLENEEHGIFAIRSPHRPNHIGLSIVKLIKIEDNIITFSEVDMLNNTPLIDIKPYIAHFDCRENVRQGWVEKHFSDDRMPDNLILK